eukprot:732330-Amorphochlora_amoeboformis.AAC.3
MESIYIGSEKLLGTAEVSMLGAVLQPKNPVQEKHLSYLFKIKLPNESEGLMRTLSGSSSAFQQQEAFGPIFGYNFPGLDGIPANTRDLRGSRE